MALVDGDIGVCSNFTSYVSDRWDIEGNTELFQGIPVRFGAYLPAVDAFDAAAFGMSDAEASVMDPQQRLMLECAADISTAAELKSPAHLGMFLGLSSSDYAAVAASAAPHVSAYTATSALKCNNCQTAASGFVGNDFRPGQTLRNSQFIWVR